MQTKLKTAAAAVAALSVLLTLLTGSFDGVSAADAPASVLILPVTVNAQKDLSFIKEGVADMLATRLVIDGKTRILDTDAVPKTLADLTEPLKPASAAAAGKALGADYVVFGSLTVIGEAVSTDLQFIDVNTGRPKVAFSRTGKGLGEVINHVDQFAAEVAETVFGRKPTASPPPVAAAPAPGPAPAPSPAPDYRRHPDALLPPTAGPGGVAAVGTAANLWRSRTFSDLLTGLAIGDVDGDGRQETIVIATQMVYVFRLTEGRLQKIAELAGAGFDRYVHVDVADINGNGSAEIFVSNVADTNGPPASFVLEWNGAEFTRIAEREPWYYSVVASPATGRVLYGQRRSRDELFVPGIFRMNWDGARYEPGEKLPLPYNMNVYAFAVGDVLNDGTTAYAAFKGGDTLAVFDASGRELWQGGENLGGNGTYFEFVPSYLTGEGQRKDTDFFYMPLRLSVADVNGDGLNEVITVKNNARLSGVLARLRVFTNGAVTGLNWDGSGLYRQWQTREFQQYLSDCVVGDMNNDGVEEMVFTVVAGTGSTLTKPKGYIGSIDLRKEAAAAPPRQ
jgi:TolB-like protein